PLSTRTVQPTLPGVLRLGNAARQSASEETRPALAAQSADAIGNLEARSSPWESLRCFTMTIRELDGEQMNRLGCCPVRDPWKRGWTSSPTLIEVANE